MNDFEGKLIADKYRVETLISEGSSGDYYTARHEVMDRPVTLKVLPAALAIDARWVSRFVDEARSVTGLSHPGILSVTDFGTDAKGVSYAVFDPFPDTTLSELTGDEAELDEATILDITRQTASAVAAAHEKGIIHGSLNPSKVFVETGESTRAVKVLGFGSDRMTVTRDADPQYLSPEQLTEFPAADERSDIYALGTIFYKMLAGVAPFAGSKISEIKAKQDSEPPPPLSAFRPDLHSEIEPIVLTAIALDPERRYQTMKAFAEDLEIVSGRLGLPSTAAAAAAAAAEPRKRNVWQTAFIALAGVSLLAVALIYATSVKSTDPTAQLQPEAGYLPVQPIGPATGAQEESLARLPVMTEAEIMATSATTMEQPPGTLPGGDGYNAWANGGVPPPGAPLQPYIPPGGQVYTIDPNNPSQFMPADGGVILVPVPAANSNSAPGAKPESSPKTPPANSATPPSNDGPKPLATPPAKPGKVDPKKTDPAKKATQDAKPKQPDELPGQ